MTTNRARTGRTRPLMTVAIALGGAFLGATTLVTTSAVAVNQRPPAQPTAVATVDLVRVLDELKEKGVLEERLQQSLSDRQAQLDDVVNKIKTAQADLETLKPGTAAHREKIRQIVELQAVGEARRNALQQIISLEKGEMLKTIYEKINAAIAKIAERDGWDVVLLDDSGFPLPNQAPDRDMERAILTRSVLYKHNSVDVTSRVITLMNNEFGS